MASPKVSVLMPLYRTEVEYLKESISSVLEQTFSNFEFLILDDCPKDDRKDIVYSFNDKRIKYYQNNRNLGIAATRNKLVDLAQGKYLAVIDHDDIALTTRFEEQVKVLDRHPETGVVGCWMEMFPERKIILYPTQDEDIQRNMMLACCVAHTGAMVRASIFNMARYERKFSPVEDYALWCRLVGKTQFYNVPKVLMKYRCHGKNTTKIKKSQMIESTKKVQDFVRAEHPDLWAYMRGKKPHIIQMKLSIRNSVLGIPPVYINR